MEITLVDRYTYAQREKKPNLSIRKSFVISFLSYFFSAVFSISFPFIFFSSLYQLILCFFFCQTLLLCYICNCVTPFWCDIRTWIFFGHLYFMVVFGRIFHFARMKTRKRKSEREKAKHNSKPNWISCKRFCNAWSIKVLNVCVCVYVYVLLANADRFQNLWQYT